MGGLDWLNTDRIMLRDDDGRDTSGIRGEATEILVGSGATLDIVPCDETCVSLKVAIFWEALGVHWEVTRESLV